MAFKPLFYYTINEEMKGKMRAYSVVVAFGVLLMALLVLQLFALPTMAQPILTDVTYDPRRIDLSETLPPYVNATMSSRAPQWNASLVNASSILLEGTLPQLLGYEVTKFNDYVAVFDGDSVVQLIWARLYHMGVVDPSVHKPYKVELTITGKLNDETPFQGSDTIMVKMFSSTPPPPTP